MKYPILMSGFISLTADGLVPYNTEYDTYASVVLTKSHLTVNNPYFYSEELTEIYNQWSGKPEIMKEFSFREKVLTQAKRLFSTVSILSWFNAQSGQTYVGSSHQQFLNDTYNFVVHGTTRPIHIAQWLPLLNAERITVTRHFDYASFSGSLLTSFLQTWVTRPGGYTDLLIALHVIFGSRPYITNVADKRG